MKMTNVIAVTDESFPVEVEQHQGLLMVDFWAAWCSPCLLLAPIVEELATEYAGRVKVASLDGDANHHTMTRYGVRSLPTLLLFRNGQLVDRIVGAVPRARIEASLRQHLDSVAAA